MRRHSRYGTEFLKLEEISYCFCGITIQKLQHSHLRVLFCVCRPRSFAASPHAVILERSEESRGATPFEDDTGGAVQFVKNPAVLFAFCRFYGII